MEHFFEQTEKTPIKEFFDKTPPNCNFSDGFEFMKDGDTVSKSPKHQSGKRSLILIVLILIMLIFLILVFSTYKIIPKSIFIYTIVIVAFLIPLALFIRKIDNSPIEMFYVPSYIIASRENNKEYPDIDYYFPEHVLFEEPETFRILKKELLTVMQKKKKLIKVKDTFGGNNAEIGADIDRDNNGWKLFMIKAGTTVNKDAEEMCPTLVRLLENLPHVKSCLFSILEGDKQIPIHTGYYKGLLRYHLGLIIPSDTPPFICVNGKKYHWKEGEGMLFDDIYPHKVYNSSKKTRAIIYMDIQRKIDDRFLHGINNKMLDTILNSSIIKKEVKKTEKQI